MTERPVTQAGIWADDTLRSDAWRAGAVLLAVAFVVGLLTMGGDEVERAERGVPGVGLGALAALLTALAALGPGRRMPDWAIGLRGSASPLPAVKAPLVGLGWALGGAATLAALATDDAGQALAALAVGAVPPLAIAHSIHRFLERANRARAWARGRGLDWSPELEVPERTPLLREGEYRYATNAIEGTMLGEARATLMHLATVDIDEGHDGGSQTTRRFTALVAAVPDPGPRLPLCICAPRTPIPGYDAVDALTKKLRRIDLVSTEFEHRFELMIDRKGDEVWLRRLFEPTFIERMILLDPGRLGWELEGGFLTVYAAGYVSTPAQLDRLVELAALIRERVEREVAETNASLP